MKLGPTVLGLAITAASLAAVVQSWARAQPVTDDPFTGATVVSSPSGTFQPGALFDGGDSDPGQVTFFPNGDAGSEYAVVFQTASITLSGVRLHAASDFESFFFDRRSMSRFQVFADTDLDGTASDAERVVDQAINTDYDSGQAGDLDTGLSQIEFALPFATPVTANLWRIVVTQGVNVPPYDGVRVQEIDAIPAPAATTLFAEPPVQGLFTLTARLTNSATGDPLAGQTVVMSTSAGPACQAVTDGDGVASCSGLASAASIVLDGGYTATFAGTSELASSTADATLLAVSPTTTTTSTTSTTRTTSTTVVLPETQGADVTGAGAAPAELARTGPSRDGRPSGLLMLLAGAGLWLLLSAARRRPGAES